MSLEKSLLELQQTITELIKVVQALDIDNTKEIKRTTFTAREAANYLGFGYTVFLETVEQENIPYVANGNRKLFRKQTLDQWMDRKEQESVQVVNNDNYFKYLQSELKKAK